ncbi:MAG: TlpA family protein disulfide reductase [Saprospirales bacterium]|nr:MAG: TlpA family protein disulfide reductase [Saprospirales bacterium]
MNYLKLSLAVILIGLISNSMFGQRTLPDIDVRTLEGQNVSIKQHGENEKITFVTFWATWCVPCRRELDAIADLYPDWQEEFDMEVVAISIDDTRGMARVRPMVEQNGWDFIIYTDTNQDLKQALNFQTIPQSFLVDRKGNIVYSHTGYSPGDEIEIEEKMRELMEQ